VLELKLLKLQRFSVDRMDNMAVVILAGTPGYFDELDGRLGIASDPRISPRLPSPAPRASGHLGFSIHT
jgi:hypothetical protein